MLIKVDMQAQFDQQSLFDIMNDTLGSGKLEQYQVDPRSIALKGEFSLISLFLPLGGSMAEWLERWTCKSEAPSSSPAVTASWICSG